MTEPAPALAADERVVWQGRAAVGAAWPAWFPVAAGVGAFATSLALLVVVRLRLFPGAESVGQAALGELDLPLALGLVVGGVLLGARLAGPFYPSLSIVAVAGAVFTVVWSNLVRDRGWEAAVASLGDERLAIAAAVTALPLARIAVGVVRRLDVWVVVTTWRVLEARGQRLLWETPRPPEDAHPDVRLRAVPSWRAARGLLAVRDRRWLLRDDDPARVVDVVRDA